MTLTEEDKRSYKRDLYMTNLPEKNLYINQLKDAGFTDIQVCRKYSRSATYFATFLLKHLLEVD